MSTAAFALGPEEGRRFTEARGSAEAVFVTEDKQVYLTHGMKGVFHLTNDDYRLAE
jgi:thiamine biosynthesis lipoprotein